MATQAKASKRLFILGASGGIGRALIDQAIERGHQVTAFVRSPEKLGVPRDRLTVLKGDPRSIDELRAALPGHDAVLSALGPPGPGHTTINSDCARSTVAAMQAVGVRRLLIVSVAVLFENQGLLFWLFRKTLLRNISDDSAEMERVVVESGLDWTIVRPPTLTNGRLSGSYGIEDERMPSGGLFVSRADVAQFLLDEVERSAHVRRMVGMASSKLSTPTRPSSQAARDETSAASSHAQR
jgi:putative NADH-flavin reductase